MLKLADIYARKKEASGQVSAQTRTLALGFLAIAWTLLTAHDEPLHSMASNVSQYVILAFATIAIVVLACDLLQYVAITSFADAAYKSAEKATPQEGQYDEKSFAYKAQGWLYRVKFGLLSADAILLIGILIFLFVPSKTSASSNQQQLPNSASCSNTVISVSNTQANPPGSGHTTHPLKPNHK